MSFRSKYNPSLDISDFRIVTKKYLLKSHKSTNTLSKQLRSRHREVGPEAVAGLDGRRDARK